MSYKQNLTHELVAMIGGTVILLMTGIGLMWALVFIARWLLF